MATLPADANTNTDLVSFVDSPYYDIGIIGDKDSNWYLGTSRTAYLGYGGSDVFVSGLEAEFQAFSGGAQADTYVINSKGIMTVIDMGSSADDVLHATGIGLSYLTSYMLTIDDRHIVAYDTNSGQAIYLIDAFDPANKIEHIKLADISLSFDDLIGSYKYLPNYLGDFSWPEVDPLYTTTAIDDSYAEFSSVFTDNFLANTDLSYTPPELLPTKVIPLTNDNPIVDAFTTGYAWDTSQSTTIGWSLSFGKEGEYWLDPIETIEKLGAALETYSDIANIQFEFLGYHNSTDLTNSLGADITFSLDGNNVEFSNDEIWAKGYFPDGNQPKRGDIYLNINSAANTLPSYDLGSQGFFLALHEIGHALGLKHPHDDAGNNRPTLSEAFANDPSDPPDDDLFSVMSYNDNFSADLLQYDPATPMLHDAIALQHMYGANQLHNTGNDTHLLRDSDLSTLIWDAGGNDTLSAASSSQGWLIGVIENYDGSGANVALGTVMPDAVQMNEEDWVPSTVTWFLGELENIVGSSHSDQINGSEHEDTIFSGAGDDTLLAWGGDDFIVAQSGKNWVEAGIGNDIIFLETNEYFDDSLVAWNPATEERISLDGKARYTSVIFGGDRYDDDDGNIDTLVLTELATGDAFFLDDAFSEIAQQLFYDEEDTSYPKDEKYARISDIEEILAGAGDDIVDLTSTHMIYATDLTVKGEAGNDVLWGASGNDILNGGEGNDILFGGTGNNILIGGSGADVFEFVRTNFTQRDVIQDFSTEDTIKLYVEPGDNVLTANDYVDGELQWYDLTISLQGSELGWGDLTIEYV